MYPNPVNDIIKLELNDNIKTELQIYNMSGQMNYPAASRRGIKKPPHKAKMCAPRGGELNT
jgi:hypothetical protein